MAFCTNCGSQLSDDDLFCPNCGTKVLVENSVKKEVPQIQDKNTENEETSATESFYIDEKNEELQIAFITGSTHSPNAYNSHEVHFIKAFNNFALDENNKVNWNWAALFIGCSYFGYRGAYIESLIAWLIEILILLICGFSEVNLIRNICPFILFLIAGQYSDYIIFMKYKRVIYKIKLESSYCDYSKEHVLEKVAAAGGTHPGWISGIVLFAFAIVGFMVYLQY